MIKKHIHIIKMGGTIEFKDPAYEKINDLMKLDVSVNAYLQNLIKPHFTYDIQTVCEKDSRDITLDDLENLWDTTTASPDEYILITHGTFTMKETAQFLERKIETEGLQKKIILTGAMVPIIGFSISDAGFNLGFSLGSFDAVPYGVYLCMNGGIFKAVEVEKNTDLLRFE